MTINEVKNTPEIVDLVLDESITADARMKLHKRLDELCKLAIKALEQQPSEDCISRQKALDCFEQTNTRQGAKYAIETLPSVTPTNEDISEAYIKGYDYGVKDWFKSKTQPCEDAVSRQAVINTIFYKSDNSCDVVLSTDLMDRIKQLPSVTPRTNLAETSQDCISREEMLSLQTEYAEEMSATIFWKLRDDIRKLPPVTPQTVTEFADKCKECGKIQNELVEDAVSREAVKALIKRLSFKYYMECGEYIGEDSREVTLINALKFEECFEDLPPVTPKYTDEEIDRAQAVEQAYVDKMVELAVEESKRPRGKWIEHPHERGLDWEFSMFECSECHEWTDSDYDYCPNCGSYNGGGEHEETD